MSLKEERAKMGHFDFIYPRHRYCGQWKPEELIFDANLQEFSHRVNYISNLETNGKLSPQEAYQQIKLLWNQLKTSKEQLGIGQSTGDEGQD